MANRKRRRRPAPRRLSSGVAEAPEGSRPAAPQVRDTAEKKARRERARRRREEELRRFRRRRLISRAATVAVVATAGFVALQLFGRSSSPGSSASYVSASPVDPSTLPGMQAGPLPWNNGADAQLGARLQAIGLAALPREGTALHIHQHLDVYVDGSHVVVPADIGIGGGFAPLHTHDTSGIIHVEAETQGPFSVGEFFDIWGVRLTPDCVGSYCNAGDKTLKVYVDGHLATGDPRQIRLVKHQEIVVVFGTPSEAPNPIPSSYRFPPLI